MKHPERQPNRLKGYDYCQAGWYFVTICTKDRRCLLGRITNNTMYPSTIGDIVNQSWLEIPLHFPDVVLDEYVIMPNHLHGIIVIDHPKVGNKDLCSLQRNDRQTVWSRSLSSVLRGFKIGVTKRCREKNCGYFQWQKSFYDHVIRSEKSLHEIREYIRNNPLQWALDKDNPDNADR